MTLTPSDSSVGAGPSSSTPQPRRRGPRRQRDATRAAHLVGGLALALFVYGPTALTLALQPWMQWLVVPALSATGIALWKQAALRRMTGALRRRTVQLVHPHA